MFLSEMKNHSELKCMTDLYHLEKENNKRLVEIIINL